MARLLSQDEQIVTVTEADLGIENPDPDTTYTVRIVSRGVYRDMQRQHTKRRPVQGAMEETIDWAAFEDALLDYLLRDWTGFVTRAANGALEPLPCSKAAKLGLEPYKQGVDGHVRVALLKFASENQRVEAQAQAASFRATP